MRLKTISIFVAGYLLFACCSPSDNSSSGGNAKKEKPVLQIALVYYEAGDKSFYQSALGSLVRPTKEFRVEVRQIEIESISDFSALHENESLEKADLVIGLGPDTGKAIHEAAEAHPGRHFLLIDAPSKSENVLGIVYKAQEGGYLAGVLAGLTTKTGRIGFVGGKEWELIKRYEAGFRAGVMTVNPKAIVSVNYIKNWSESEEGKRVAGEIYDNGADIIFHSAGECGLGVIRAAEERDLYAIGCETDQDYLAPGNVLTSVLRRVERDLTEAKVRIIEGGFRGGNVVWGVKERGIGLSELKYTKEIFPPETLELVEQAGEMIRIGALIVPSTPDGLASFQPPQL